MLTQGGGNDMAYKREQQRLSEQEQARQEAKRLEKEQAAKERAKRAESFRLHQQEERDKAKNKSVKNARASTAQRTAFNFEKVGLAYTES
jgi:hypothetical protein